jgi:lipopolysaccharide/colanic/teichoic acid biosynthesis glycosyltransferase
MTLVKRSLDVVASAAGLVLLAPLLAAIALAVGRDGPVFFRQERVGRGGRIFRIWKFRTMVPDAERRGSALTVAGDPRITRTGAWLRRTKLDELPQLLNVLRGEMSLVGPRPEVPRYVALYTPAQRRVLELVPGITDPASVRYRDEAGELSLAADPQRHYAEVVLPDKIRLNLDYAARATAASDLRILLRTVGALASSGGTRESAAQAAGPVRQAATRRS